MVITLHRKGHLEETYPLHFTKSKSGPRFTYRPSGLAPTKPDTNSPLN